MKFDLSNLAQVQKYQKKIKERVPKVMRMFMIEAYRQVTISTPVDTGRARWGWNCSVGNPDLTVPASAPKGWIGRSKGGTEFYGQDFTRSKKTFSVKAVSGDKTTYIANAVPYIGILNEGYSDQSPARFVELAFVNAVNKLKIYLLQKGWLAE